MALSFSKVKGNVSRNYYQVYMRETATAIASADYDTLVHWNTFLALFTEIGHIENKQSILNCVPSDPVELELGEEHFLAMDGTFECKFLQSAVADDTALDDMSGKDCDLLLVSTNGLKWVYVHNKRFKVEKNIVSGEIESSKIYHKQVVAERSDYYTSDSIPTV